jgi:hypothetical protein
MGRTPVASKNFGTVVLFHESIVPRVFDDFGMAYEKQAYGIP